MRKLYLILFASICSLNLFAQFRETTWGMTEEQVKKTEKASFAKSVENALFYTGDVAGLETYIIYIFANNQLVRSKYVFTAEHSNKNEFLTDFSKLKKILTDKYGNPGSDDDYWKNDLYKDDYSQWGFAVSLGHFVKFTSWSNDNTDITLALTGSNYQINLQVEYVSKTLGIKEDETKNAKLNELLTDNGFRKAAWGVSKAAVRPLEIKELFVEKDNFLAYKDQFAGFDCAYLYIFCQNQLVRGKYTFTEEHTNKNDYIMDYNSLIKLLTARYGEPESDETLWQNDLYKDDYQDWGFAVSLGHLMKYASWKLPESEITLLLSGENYSINLALEFQSVKLQNLEKEAEKHENNSNF